MPNKTQLQTNNTKYASLIETLRGKAAGGSGEDVTDETNAYTAKLASLETAVAALETELEGKASGGSGGNDNIDTCTVNIISRTGLPLYVAATQYKDKISSYYVSNSGLDTVTIENVVCGSIISFITNSPILPGYSVTDEAALIAYELPGGGHSCWYFSAPIVANANATITVRDDD
jgi:hypothetical protein